ncbi:MAG: helix-turn-helix domain-containing protein [Oscillospiraceae bacterium]|nr:helix-turn-helix domain-containing protein [Oscillospiraceae bacterium]
MKLGELIIEYRDRNKLSQRQFADKCGLSNGYISMLERGINPKTQKPITPTIPQLKKLADGMVMTITEILDRVDDMPIDLSAPGGNIIPFPEMNQVPLIGAIACGAPILAQEHIEEFVDMPKHVRADFALTCKGDSMINARIFDGDIVYIRQQETVENGEIAAILIDGEATLKRVKIYDDHISLEPENPQYRPIVLWGEEMNTIYIIGKAVAFTSTVR